MFWRSATVGHLLLAAAAGILNYALPFWLYLTALTRMPVARAATYLTLILVFGVLGAVLVLGERVTWVDLIGGVLVVGCLLVDATAGTRTDEDPLAAVGAGDCRIRPRPARDRRIRRRQHVPHRGRNGGHPAPDRRARARFDLRHDLPAAIELLDAADRPVREAVENAARASGTPFVSFHSPQEMPALAREAGFADARHVAGSSHAERYFAGRTDGLRPLSGEDVLIATT